MSSAGSGGGEVVIPPPGLSEGADEVGATPGAAGSDAPGEGGGAVPSDEAAEAQKLI